MIRNSKTTTSIWLLHLIIVYQLPVDMWKDSINHCCHFIDNKQPIILIYPLEQMNNQSKGQNMPI